MSVPPGLWACCSESSECSSDEVFAVPPWLAAGCSDTETVIIRTNQDKFMHEEDYYDKIWLLTATEHASVGCYSVWGSEGEPGVSSGGAGCPACCCSGPDTAGLLGWWTAGLGCSRCHCGSDSGPAYFCCSPGPLESLSADCSWGPLWQSENDFEWLIRTIAFLGGKVGRVENKRPEICCWIKCTTGNV